MKSKNIGYHTRLNSDNKVKVVGGSFGGSIDQETIERLVKVHFTAKVMPSGRAVFVDRQGREVSLYLSVDPMNTEVGKAAFKDHAKALQAAQEDENRKLAEIEELLDGLSTDEIIKRLK